MKWLGIFLALWVGTAQAQSIPFPGPGTPHSSGATYQGPGDVVTGASAMGFYSCARAYNAAFAATQGAVCTVVDTATGVASCTFNVGTNGFANLTALICLGGTVNIVTFCTVTHIGCSVTEAFDQTGTGNHITNVTLAQMPVLTFSALNGLPGMTCTSAAGSRLLSGNLTQAQPFTFAAVAKKTASTTAGFIGSNGTMPGLVGAGANSWGVSGGTALQEAATDGVFHAGQGVLNGASSAISIDGTTTTGAGGANGFSAAPISMCRANGGSIDATNMEGIVWGSALNATQYGNINTNQHSATNGYNF